jgi:hypothetical protein
MSVAYYQLSYVEGGTAVSDSCHCANCGEPFLMGSYYPEDTFCCSHCVNKYHGDQCEGDCVDCKLDEVD